MSSTAVLGRDALFLLISQNQFYPVGGPFTEVGQLVKDAWPAYVESAKTNCCGPRPQLLFPALDRLFSLLREEGATGDTARQALKTFLTNQKGYEVKQVLLYYRKGTEPRPEKLDF